MKQKKTMSEQADAEKYSEHAGMIEVLEAAEHDRIALEHLTSSELKFRSVAQSAVDAILTTDADDTVVFWNNGAEKMFGYSPNEILGQSATKLIPDKYQQAHRDGMKRYLRTGRPVLIGGTVELEALRKNGEIFPIELSLSTWKTEDGVFFSGIIRDITDRKEVERKLKQKTEELEHRNGELESLIQMVAHDLKSPIITIVAMVKMLRKKMVQLMVDQQRDQILDQLGYSSEAMERFLNDLMEGLLNQSKAPDPAPVQLISIISEVIQRHSKLLEDKGIEVLTDLPSECVIRADKHRITQVIDNLILNAVRHMGENPAPEIRVNVCDRGRFVEVTVADNGVGIPEEFRTKIFDRFFRIRPDGGGTGLGLFITRKIVEAHDGRIWVEPAEGKGAVFRFTLRKDGPEGRVVADKTRTV